MICIVETLFSKVPNMSRKVILLSTPVALNFRRLGRFQQINNCNVMQ